MSLLGQTIREIRKAQGKDQAEFARELGCARNTVSRYELGTLEPSRGMLVMLLRLARNEQRGPILDALGVEKSQQEGWAEGELEEALNTFEQYLAAPKRGRPLTDDSRQRFIEMAKAIAGDGTQRVPLWLLQTMEFWLANKSHPDAAVFFEHIPIYLDVQIKGLGGRVGDPNMAKRSKT